jgi:UDP-glucose 4-epimerase
MQNRTLVAGGAGYLGSQAFKVLAMAGFRPAMSNGFPNRSPEFHPLGA